MPKAAPGLGCEEPFTRARERYGSVLAIEISGYGNSEPLEAVLKEK
jgi:hypothetical protein